MRIGWSCSRTQHSLNTLPPVLSKSAYWKIIFLISQPNICCGYSKSHLNETVLLSTQDTCIDNILMGKEINTSLGAQTILIWAYVRGSNLWPLNLKSTLPLSHWKTSWWSDWPFFPTFHQTVNSCFIVFRTGNVLNTMFNSKKSNEMDQTEKWFFSEFCSLCEFMVYRFQILKVHCYLGD